MIRRVRLRIPILALAALAATCAAHAQAPVGLTPAPGGLTPASGGLIPFNAPVRIPDQGPLPTFSPEVLQLFTLDGEFSKSVEAGGGAAFASWFADDAVTLSNGKAPVLTKAGILDHARWKPDEYRLQWTPMGAKMSDSGDMGFTWGHYDATTFHPGAGSPTVLGGRYITIWKKQADGKWKVALDASADEPKS